MFLYECSRSRTVHLLVRKRLGQGMSEYLVRRLRAAPNVRVHEGVEVCAVHGDRRLDAISLCPTRPDAAPRDGAPTGNGPAAADAPPAGDRLPVAAAFVFIGAEPGC